MKVKFRDLATYDKEDALHLETECIYLFINQPVVFYAFDIKSEQTMYRTPADAFYVLTSKKKMIHLISGGENVKRVTGYEYYIDYDPEKCEVTFDKYYSLDAENVLFQEEDTIGLLHRMQK